MSIENKVEFLWNCALSLKGDQQMQKVLKSYYVNICRKLSKNNLSLPKEKLSSSQMCSHCGNFWYEGQFHMKSTPKRLSKNTKAKKLIEKLNNSSNPNNRPLLNKKQRKRAKWLQKKCSNNLGIKCENCKRKSTLILETVRKKDANNMNPDFIKHKQLSYTEENIISKAENYNKTPGNNIRKKMLQGSKGKLHQVEIKSGHRKKKVDILSSKVISKTQQQNSLLQLAALLNKNSQTASKDKISKLDSFLK